MSPAPGDDPPPDPEDAPEPPPGPLLGLRFWLLIAFAALCIASGLVVAMLGPVLVPAGQVKPSANPALGERAN